MPRHTHKPCNRHDIMIFHRFSVRQDRPHWHYIGPPVFRDPTDPRTQRSHNLTSARDRSHFKWRIDLQAKAVSHGFFLHRTAAANSVAVVGVDPNGPIFCHYSDYTNEAAYAGERMMRELERRDFKEGGASFYATVLRFIKQQDQFGYSGAWDDKVMFYTWPMKWYQNYRVTHKLEHNLTERELHVKANVIKASERGHDLAQHGFAGYVRRKITRA